MANEPIKRLRYFTGQFLEATDFEAEQRYHSDMRHRGNRMLYDSAGIIDGLKVTPVNLNPVTKIKISPGIAVDGQGRELVLVESVTVNLPAALRHSLTYFVTLTYDQQETDEQTPHDHDISDATRYQEWPKVEFFKDQPDLAIVLAKVTVDGTGNLSGSIDASMRQYANGRFPGNLTVGAGGVGGIKASHIDGINHSSEEKGDLLLNWNTETNVLIGCKEKKSSLLVSGNLGVGTNTLENKEDSGRVVDVVGTDSSRLSVRTTTDKIDARVQVQARDPELWGSKPGLVIGTKSNHALSLGTKGATHLTIDTEGKVGIGRPDPQATLHVAGNVKIDGTLSWGGDQVGNNYIVIGGLQILWGTQENNEEFRRDRLIKFQKPFISPPAVTTTIIITEPSWLSNSKLMQVGVYNVSKESFNIQLEHGSQLLTTTIDDLSFCWIAIGKS